MVHDAQLLKVIQLLYPTARHVAIAPIGAGQMETETSEQSFVLATLYDHKVGSQMRPIAGRFVIISNTYLASHAYNIGMCHLVGTKRLTGREAMARLYRHNFKKFFAEQILYRQNVLIGRALLAETILYEQDLMRESFFHVVKLGLEAQATEISRLASETVSHHELAHYFETRTPDFGSQYQAQTGLGFEDIDEDVFNRGGAKLRTEFRCDVIAATSNLAGQTVFEKGDLLRGQLFVFYVLAELVSLTKSAMATAEAGIAEEVRIDLSSAEPPREAFTFQLGRDLDFDVRVDAIERALIRLAEKEGTPLFDENAAFPLARETRTILQQAQQSIGELDESPIEGLTGTDALRRGLAQILAESLKGHDAGANFLLWRSKKFNQANNMRFG
jgi:hypothetical protein